MSQRGGRTCFSMNRMHPGIGCPWSFYYVMERGPCPGQPCRSSRSPRRGHLSSKEDRMSFVPLLVSLTAGVLGGCVTNDPAPDPRTGGAEAPGLAHFVLKRV